MTRPGQTGGGDVKTQAMGPARGPDEFSRLHALFVEHFGYAVLFAWLAAASAAARAPWTNNLRGLLDPLGRVESTASYLFTLPMLMAAAWACVAVGEGALRRTQVLKRPAAEFTLAGAVAFAVFCLAVDRAVTAFLIG